MNGAEHLQVPGIADDIDRVFYQMKWQTFLIREQFFDPQIGFLFPTFPDKYTEHPVRELVVFFQINVSIFLSSIPDQDEWQMGIKVHQMIDRLAIVLSEILQLFAKKNDVITQTARPRPHTVNMQEFLQHLVQTPGTIGYVECGIDVITN